MRNPTTIFVVAMKAIDDAGVPPELREVAFVKAIEMLTHFEESGGNGVRSRQGAGSTPAGSGAPENGAGHEDLLGRIADRLKLDRTIVAEIYEEADGEVRVVVSPRKLDKSKMGATKQMALLVAAAQQAAGIEEATSVDKIRDAAEHYGIHDHNNFARTITDMDDDFIISGSGRSRLVRLRRPAWDKAKDSINQLGGGET